MFRYQIVMCCENPNCVQKTYNELGSRTLWKDVNSLLSHNFSYGWSQCKCLLEQATCSSVFVCGCLEWFSCPFFFLKIPCLGATFSVQLKVKWALQTYLSAEAEVYMFVHIARLILFVTLFTHGILGEWWKPETLFWIELLWMLGQSSACSPYWVRKHYCLGCSLWRSVCVQEGHH